MAPCQLKKPFKGPRWSGDEGVARRNGSEKSFPNKGSLICPPGKSMILYKKETEKMSYCPDLQPFGDGDPRVREAQLLQNGVDAVRLDRVAGPRHESDSWLQMPRFAPAQ